MTFILDADRTCIYISTTQKLIIDSFQVILNLTSYLLNRFIKIKCILKYKERVIIHDKQKRYLHRKVGVSVLIIKYMI